MSNLCAIFTTRNAWVFSNICGTMLTTNLDNGKLAGLIATHGETAALIGSSETEARVVQCGKGGVHNSGAL